MLKAKIMELFKSHQGIKVAPELGFDKSYLVGETPQTVLMSADDDFQRGGGIREAIAPEEVKLKPPSMYRVVLLNDDYTPMEFVVEILCSFFSMNAETATQVMLKVHTEGKGICGVFPKDIAETKAVLVNEYSRTAEHPLLCDIEIDD